MGMIFNFEVQLVYHFFEHHILSTPTIYDQVALSHSPTHDTCGKEDVGS